MPIPQPKLKEKRNEFVSRCVSKLSKIDSDKPRKQIIAICFNAWKQEGKIGVRGGDRGGERRRNLMKLLEK